MSRAWRLQTTVHRARLMVSEILPQRSVTSAVPTQSRAFIRYSFTPEFFSMPDQARHSVAEQGHGVDPGALEHFTCRCILLKAKSPRHIKDGESIFGRSAAEAAGGA